jgi:C4-dicarboxylate-specific signal transduction histidine kinase
MRYSLGFILAISLAGLQFIAIFVVVTTSYLSSEQAMLKLANELMKDAGANAVEHTKRFLEPAGETTEQAKRVLGSGLVSTTDRDTMESYFFHLLQTTPQLAGINYGDEAGNFVYVMKSDGPGPYRTKFITIDNESRSVDFIWRSEDYSIVEQSTDPTDIFDVRTRPWYIKARALGSRIWAAPYIFFSSQQPGITVAAPVVFPNNTLQGVVSVDIEISDISVFLSDLRVGDNGAALILNQDGSVLAHPDQNQITVLNDDGTLSFANINDINDPISRAAFAGFDKTDVSIGSSQLNFTYQDNKYLGLFSPITEIDLPWTIAVYAPEDDFIGVIKENRARNIWIAALISVFTALAGLTLAELILRPVRAFAVRTSLVSQGEVSADEPLPKTYRELQAANRTLLDEIAHRRNSEMTVQQLNRDLAHFSRVNVMGQMATGLAHELSQPLTAITQNVDAAISTASQNADENQDLLEILRELDEQAHQGGDIIRALRGFIRKDDAEVSMFDLHELVAQTCHLMRHEAEVNSVNLDYTFAALPNVKGSRVQIAQVLINLMRNAIEAIASSNAKARTITIEVQEQADRLVICVDDTGPGISKDVILFKQFQTSKADGMGLGLSICRKIVESNGGQLWHESDVRAKTRFCFTLPTV